VSLPFRYKVLAAIYGGIAEELIMRLGVFSLLLWLWKLLFEGDTNSLRVLWSVNLVTSLLFAAGHLPATAALLPLTRPIVLRTLLMNVPVSLAFGFAYFTWGLEASMLAHTCASLVLQLANTPRLFRRADCGPS
jgi:membrane protease YdiL (CAAX protease family)